MTALSEWQNFYVIVGSSAGALIGLQFVVLTLIAEMPGIRRGAEVGATFSTPTTMHFVSALVLAAVMAIPWHSLAALAAVLGVAGVAGFIYAGVTTWRLRRQDLYKPEFEDWLFYSILPFVAYAVLIVSAVCLFGEQFKWLFGVAGTSLLLLLIGIHNAWDTVTYHVFVMRKTPEKSESKRSSDGD